MQYAPAELDAAPDHRFRLVERPGFWLVGFVGSGPHVWRRARLGQQEDVTRLHADLPAWPEAYGTPHNRETLWRERYQSPPRPIGERIDLEVWLPVT